MIRSLSLPVLYQDGDGILSAQVVFLIRSLSLPVLYPAPLLERSDDGALVEAGKTATGESRTMSPDKSGLRPLSKSVARPRVRKSFGRWLNLVFRKLDV